MKRLLPLTIASAAILAAAAAVSAQSASPGDRAWTQLDDLRVATARYHDVSAAIADGFPPFSTSGGTAPTCFDHPGQGGMGVHYVHDIDGTVDAMDPEAAVYEVVDPDHLRLVASEYIVPASFVEDASGNVVNLPNVLGQDFHKNETLGVYVLHAWIWEPNPAGTFADFNPNVGMCPASSDSQAMPSMSMAPS
jgi:hypothetical protein